MRIGLPLSCSQGVTDDLRFKPLKRLPFGPDSVIKRFDYIPPDPPPPQDFYPEKPKHWKLRGTPANRTKTFVLTLGAIYGTVTVMIAIHYAERVGDRWWKRLTGKEFPPTDELASNIVGNQMRNRMNLHCGLNPEKSEFKMRDMVEGWRRLSGRGGDYSPTGTGNEGDPRGPEL